MTALPVDFLANYDDASVLAELRRLAEMHGSDNVTKIQIERSGRVSYSLIVKRFGSLRQALEHASLRPTRFMNASDEELLAILVELWQRVMEKEGRTPQRKDLKAYGYSVSGDTVLRRFGSWKKALLKASDSASKTVVAAEVAAAESPVTSGERKPLSLRKRFFVMRRDHFSCVRCGASGVGVHLEMATESRLHVVVQIISTTLLRSALTATGANVMTMRNISEFNLLMLARWWMGSNLAIYTIDRAICREAIEAIGSNLVIYIYWPYDTQRTLEHNKWGQTRIKFKTGPFIRSASLPSV